MKKAANVIYSLQSNKALKEQARIRRKAQNDFYNDMTVAHDKGRAEGRAEGEQIGLQRGEQIGLQRGIAEVLAKMKNAGYSQVEIDKILNVEL